MCVCKYIYIYVYVYVCVCLSVCMFLCVSYLAKLCNLTKFLNPAFDTIIMMFSYNNHIDIVFNT